VNLGRRHCVNADDTQTEKSSSAELRISRVVTMLLGNSLRQTVHTHRASVHQAAKLVPALLRVAGVTAGLAKSNGSLPPGLWLASPAGWLPRTGNRDQLWNPTVWATFTLPYMSWNLTDVASIGFAVKCDFFARGRVAERRLSVAAKCRMCNVSEMTANSTGEKVRIAARIATT